MHQESFKPLPLAFRWAMFPFMNIPIILGLSVLPPTPVNQIFFQALNQSYNFGLNFYNASLSNDQTPQEIGISYVLAVASSIVGSVGLRKYLERRKNLGLFGRGMLMSTPFIGLVAASATNLFFSRSKEILNGVSVLHPETEEEVPGVKSKIAARLAFADSLLVRVLIPLPVFFIPMFASKFAARSFSFYKRKVPKLAYDVSVSYATIWGSLVFAMSFFNPKGRKLLKELEPEVQEKLKGFSGDTIIKFNKGI